LVNSKQTIASVIAQGDAQGFVFDIDGMNNAYEMHFDEMDKLLPEDQTLPMASVDWVNTMIEALSRYRTNATDEAGQRRMAKEYTERMFDEGLYQWLNTEQVNIFGQPYTLRVVPCQWNREQQDQEKEIIKSIYLDAGTMDSAVDDMFKAFLGYGAEEAESEPSVNMIRGTVWTNDDGSVQQEKWTYQVITKGEVFDRSEDVVVQMQSEITHEGMRSLSITTMQYGDGVIARYVRNETIRYGEEPSAQTEWSIITTFPDDPNDEWDIRLSETTSNFCVTMESLDALTVSLSDTAIYSDGFEQVRGIAFDQTIAGENDLTGTISAYYDTELMMDQTLRTRLMANYTIRPNAEEILPEIPGTKPIIDVSNMNEDQERLYAMDFTAMGMRTMGMLLQTQGVSRFASELKTRQEQAWEEYRKQEDDGHMQSDDFAA
jgi:hypothetical protein